ncbi:MAG: flagellar protein FlaG [Pseudomonadota bacterium]
MPRDGKKTSSGQQKDDKSSLLAAVNNVSSYVQNISREVHLYVDDSGGDTLVTVVDSRSGRTIRQVPPYEIISISRQISAHRSDPIKGLLFKSEA